MAILRVYTDTSVIGGCFDKEFAEDSRQLFALAREHRVIVLISQIVANELADAPDEVCKVLSNLPIEAVQYIPITPEVVSLRDAYLMAGVVGPKWADDATHVAAATVAGADAIVSWNFRHIVRLDRIGRYNQVNQEHGYRPLTIITPLEVTREIDSED